MDRSLRARWALTCLSGLQHDASGLHRVANFRGCEADEPGRRGGEYCMPTTRPTTWCVSTQCARPSESRTSRPPPHHGTLPSRPSFSLHPLASFPFAPLPLAPSRKHHQHPYIHSPIYTSPSSLPSSLQTPSQLSPNHSINSHPTVIHLPPWPKLSSVTHRSRSSRTTLTGHM